MTHRYRPEIDGLRAVAIVPVVLYHAGFPFVAGGFAGVDVFFVISGYLITSIIAAERSTGTFSLIGFYHRRMRRIFPALFLMMAVCVPIAVVVLTPHDLKEFSESLISSAFFYSNIYFLYRSDYFAIAAELKPLLHTWSLAVEEQFYIFFPIALHLTWRFGRRWQFTAMSILAMASLALAQWLVTIQPSAAFFLLPTRLWELMIGALVAYRLMGMEDSRLAPAAHSGWLGLAGLAMIFAAVLGFDRDTAFPGYPALLPTLGTVLIILNCSPADPVGRLLSHRVPVMIGLVSYSLYLWHYPLLAFARHIYGSGNPMVLGAACLLAALLAYLSWKHVETPIRRARHMKPFAVFGLSGLAAGLIGAIGLAGIATGGMSDFYTRYRLEAATRATYDRFQHHADLQLDLSDDGICAFRSEALDAALEKRFVQCAGRFGKAVIVLGDSHAINIHNMLFKSKRRPFLVAIARGGCRPYKPKPACPYENLVSFAKKHRNAIEAIVFHQSGSHLILDQLGHDDSDAAFVEGNRYRIAGDLIFSVMKYLEVLAADNRVIWLGPFAEPRLNLQDPQNYESRRFLFRGFILKIFAELDARLKADTAGQNRFKYVSLLDRMAFAPGSIVSGDCLIFRDEDHFSNCGENMYAADVAESLDLHHRAAP